MSPKSENVRLQHVDTDQTIINKTCITLIETKIIIDLIWVFLYYFIG
ncbi:hypothetical protein N480_03150 [Pseudoalteromonas luteoviolacea S2607]|nr:hypothetical protein N480_03150 [Pseudoalteromonas luteoviolacea S2607]